MNTNNGDVISTSSENPPSAAILVSGTSSGVGKTTLTVGLIAAYASRGYIVQPFKCGPDFLDGMHHEAAIRSANAEYRKKSGGKKRKKGKNDYNRKCVNLDAWMMGSTSAMINSFHLHSAGADICIIEGCMGLHDSKDGTSDEGSTAQIAKVLQVPVVLVVDGSKMARSVAAMALGYALYDSDVRLSAVVANKVSGAVHVKWIRESIEKESARLKDNLVDRPTYFAGALPNDTAASIPERHLGLTMPSEQALNNETGYLRLACLIEAHLDLDKLLDLGQTYLLQHRKVPHNIRVPPPRCRIAVADDEAFCFYYRDNLHLLRMAGAELVPFSPLYSERLPPCIDGIYMGGGYPELHAEKLESNISMRKDIRSYSQAGGTIFAECGGFMYLAKTLIASKDEPPRHMCGVFPICIRMTPHAKMYYADIEILPESPLKFSGKCRGQRFHFSEVFIQKDDSSDINKMSPFLVTPLLPGAEPQKEGYFVNNTLASYFHLHFSSFTETDQLRISAKTTRSFAEQFVEKAIKSAPHRKAKVISFVSVATEIIFALQAESNLLGVTSVCDYPSEARCAPRQVVCRSPIDASKLSSEEVDRFMEDLKRTKMESNEGPPGFWLVDTEALRRMKPQIVFVQNTCDICDPSTDDVLYALDSIHDGDSSEKPDIIRIAPTKLDGMFQAIATIAKALDILEKGDELIRTTHRRLQRISEEVKKLKTPRPRVLSLEGLAPLCVGGNWLPDMKYAAGCVDAFGDEGGCPARVITWEEILKADPDILVISPCSASTERTLNEIHLLASASEFWKLQCVQKGEVYIFSHGCFSRPGPRLVEGVEMMAALFRNIAPPESVRSKLYSKWAKEALKYQCRTNPDNGKDSKAASHCTTELSFRFTSCFENSDVEESYVCTSQALAKDQSPALDICRVTRCTIPSSQLPADRSAHCLLPIYRKGSNTLSLLLFGGESQDSKRLCDTWELHPPTDGWSVLCPLGRTDAGKPKLGAEPTWEKLMCGKVADENVPTPRSNHGWAVDNVTPLANCELLHSETLCWTHCSTRGSIEPGARGNPTLIYLGSSNHVVLFGGWNGTTSLNDLWLLCLNSWQWQDISAKKSEEKLWPKPRTDHSAVLWEKSEEVHSMLVFGGNVEADGPCAELWELEFPDSDQLSNHTWKLVDIEGPSPPPRTSHAAALVGKGFNAKMVIVGGTSSSLGTGPGSMFNKESDNDSVENKSAWIKLDWSGVGLNRCRHSMAAVDDRTVVFWGGYDGEGTVSDEAGIWRGRIDGNSEGFEDRGPAKLARKNDSLLQERWQAEVPVRQDDLPREMLEKAKRSRLPGALYKAIHRYSVENNRDTYIDPASGYSVFTSVYLKRRQCCGNGCRHCPHGHVNVPGRKKKEFEW